MEKDNPASRLHHIFLEGQKLNHTTTCQQAWGSILSVPNDKPMLLMSRLGKVMAMPEEIINRVAIYDPSLSDTHSQWSKRLELAFNSKKLNEQWGPFIKLIDDSVMNPLKMLSSIIDREEHKEVLSSDTLLEIKDKIYSLKNEALESEIDQSFKRFILIYLQKIISAIDEYEISGVEPIIEAVEITVGHAFTDGNYRENMKAEFGKKLLTTLNVVASLLTVAVGVPALPDAMAFYFGIESK